MKKPFLLFCWLYLIALHSQAVSYQLQIADEAGHPVTGVLAATLDGSRLVGESDFNGVLLTTGLNATDSLQLQLLGYERIVGTAQGLGWKERSVNQVTLLPEGRLLTTIAVIGRRNELAREMPYLVETVGAKDISLLQSSNSADALADLSGVYVQKSQFGGGSPVVRGFEANRVLLVIDGVRMNNAIFRNGHLQNAITVDVNALQRMELIYGPGSLAYGSDALGGVIHFRTREPRFRSDGGGWKLGGQLSYSTAANAKRAGLQLEFGSEKFAAYTQISLSDFGDLRAGSRRPGLYPDFGRRDNYLERIDNRDSLLVNDDADVQIGTAYRQLDLLQKFRFSLAEQVELKANFQLSTSSNVPRYDNLSEINDGELRWAEWNYGPQNRVLASLRMDDRRGTNIFDLTSIILSQQFIEEDRISRRNGQAERESSEVDVYSTNFQWDFAKSFSGSRQLNYGLDARYDLVESKAALFDVDNGQPLDEVVATRYPSEASSLATAGIYVDYKHPVSKRVLAQAGLRLNRQWLGAKFGLNDPVQWPQEYLEGITSSAGALTGAASLRYTHEQDRLRILFAQGFRSPNIDDFAKFRERNGFIQIPNPELGSERSNSLELGYERNLTNGRFWIAIYHTWLNNAIIRDAFQLPNGDDFFLSFGDTLRVQANVNAESARIYGFDLGIEKRFENGLKFSGDVHWLKGVRKQRAPNGVLLELPQDHIPPIYGNISLGYQKNNWEARLRYRFQFAKSLDDYAVSSIMPVANGFVFDRTGTSDNLELTPVDPVTGSFAGTYGWSTFNLNVSCQVGSRIRLNLGVENIFDVHYRTFASGVSAAGRNLLVGGVYSFKD